MTNVFGQKGASPRKCAELLEPLFGVKFRRRRQDRPGPGWFVAENTQGTECLVVLPVIDENDQAVHSSANGYDVLFYVYSSDREEILTRRLSTETRFRYLEPSEKLDRLIHQVLEPKKDQVND